MSKKSWLYQNGRPNIELSFLTSTGQQTEKRLIADTGNPVAFIISFHDLEEISLGGAPSIGSPWGMLFGAWVEVFIPELQFKKRLVAYANDVIASLTQAEGFDRGRRGHNGFHSPSCSRKKFGLPLCRISRI